MSDGSAPMPYTEADVALVAGLLPGLIAMEHGCLPEECDLTSDTTAEGWQSIAKNIVAGLAAAGRLLPEGASSRHLDDLEAAWGLIANAWEGCWEEAPADWRAAAERWRDERWHKLLEERYPRSGEHR